MDTPPDNIVSIDFGRARRKSTTDDAIPKELPALSLEKRRAFEELLEFGIVSIAFDPKAPLVEVPRNYRSSAHMVLNFSYRFHIHDFKFDDYGTRATLTFPEGYFCCYVPWDAVFSMHSDKAQKSLFWPDSSPPAPHLTLLKDD